MRAVSNYLKFLTIITVKRSLTSEYNPIYWMGIHLVNSSLLGDSLIWSNYEKCPIKQTWKAVVEKKSLTKLETNTHTYN